jgi:chemotaxis protein MotA
MDPASIIGIVAAFGAVFTLLILEGGSIGEILLPAPLILVFGGTLGVALAGGLLKDMTGMFASLKGALLTKIQPPDALLDDIVKLAEKARREGLLALEDGMKDVENAFLRKGLQLAVDGTDQDELQDILEAEVEAKRKQDKVNAKILADMGAYAPTVGIVGTTLGLINALSKLDQPELLGHLIAAAFVATLWGLLSANLMWLPLSAKIKRISEYEATQMELVIAGIVNIQSGANPRLVGQKLRSMLPPGTAPAEDKKAA